MSSVHPQKCGWFWKLLEFAVGIKSEVTFVEGCVPSKLGQLTNSFAPMLFAAFNFSIETDCSYMKHVEGRKWMQTPLGLHYYS